MAKSQTSIKEVADAAGVSIATVSNVFSGKKPVNPKLAEHVKEVAKKFGYRVNRAASNLRSGESKIVPVLVPDLSDPFYTSLVTEVESHAHLDGYEIIVANSQDDPTIEQGRIGALMSWQPAGMIIVPVSDKVPKRLHELRDDFPIVLADRGTENEGFDVVRVDNSGAGAWVGDLLAELGHKRVLLVASDMRLHGIRERCRGAVERIEADGGIAEVIEIGPMPNEGAEHLTRWFENHQVPTAIFAMTDMTTLATLTYLAESKLEIGHDISVVGFDDYPWMTARKTPITAIRQPIEEIASTAWAKLKQRIGGEENISSSQPLKCTMKIRASTQPPH